MEQFYRCQPLLGQEYYESLKTKTVAVFGIGGVGGYVVEALARSGVGNLHLVDNDTVSISNLNRQIIATHSSIGKFKVDIAKERVFDINPNCNVTVSHEFYLPETAKNFDFSKFSYVVDAVDTVSAKLDIVEKCKNMNIPVISVMGTGNKLNPTLFKVSDISKTSVCPLARVMRSSLKKRGISSLKVVFSEEIPHESGMFDTSKNKSIPASVSFVPPVAGFIAAGEVIKDLLNIKD